MAKFKAKGHSNSSDCSLPPTGGCRYDLPATCQDMVKVDNKENSILHMYCKMVVYNYWTGIVEWNHRSYTPVTMVLLGIVKLLHAAGRSMLWHTAMSPKSHYPLTPFTSLTYSPPYPPPPEVTPQNWLRPVLSKLCPFLGIVDAAVDHSAGAKNQSPSQESSSWQLSPYRNKESGHRCDQYVNSDTLRVSYRIFGKGGGPYLTPRKQCLLLTAIEYTFGNILGVFEQMRCNSCCCIQYLC